MNRSPRFPVCMLALIACAGTVHAEPPQDSPLSGPEVRDRDVPGERDSFGTSAPAMTGERPIPHRVFMRIVSSLDSDEIDPALRATPEQIERVRAVEQEVREAAEKFRKEHEGEFRELRALLGDLNGMDGNPRERRENVQERIDPMLTPPEGDAPRKGDDAKTAEARARFRELRAQSPKPEDYHAKIWAVLSEPQQAHVRAKVDEYRAQQEQERAERYVQNQREAREKTEGELGMQGAPAQEKAPAQPGAPAQGQVRERFARMLNDLPPFDIESADPEVRALVREMRAKVESLTPEQRRQFMMAVLQGMREQMGAGQNAAPGRRGRGQGPGEPRPAPGMEGVEVPPPPREMDGEPV